MAESIAKVVKAEPTTQHELSESAAQELAFWAERLYRLRADKRAIEAQEEAVRSRIIRLVGTDTFTVSSESGNWVVSVEKRETVSYKDVVSHLLSNHPHLAFELGELLSKYKTAYQVILVQPLLGQGN